MVSSSMLGGPGTFASTMAMPGSMSQVATHSTGDLRRYSFYTPELNLLAETERTTDADPQMAYEYIWFGGQPVAQVDVATGAIDWTFTDHLGTPIMQTDANATVTWRVEYEPYGDVYEIRAGEGKHQPLRFPGQEFDAEAAERAYNVFRWYRARWGRYTQTDPITASIPYRYADDSPLSLIDRLGLFTYSNDVTWRNDATNGAWTALPTLMTATHKCKELPCDRYYLQFDLQVQTAVHLPPKTTALYPCYVIAELNHVMIFDGAVMKWMSAVTKYERSYASKSACEEAANAGHAALRDTAVTSGLKHFLAQALEEARHNIWNPCPFAGTP
jgi:RHS repeat-associated protein